MDGSFGVAHDEPDAYANGIVEPLAHRLPARLDDTVYFWPDLKKAFAEVFRVLKPDGIFTFSYGDESSSTMRYWANDNAFSFQFLPRFANLLT